MSIFTIPRVDQALSIARSVFPRAVRSSGQLDDWNVVASGLIALAADLLEGIAGAPPPRGRLRAEIMGRSLAEYVIEFAWLAGTDEAERAVRLRSLEKDEFSERHKAERKLVDQIAGREAYKRFFEPDANGNSRMPRDLLDHETRDRHERLKDAKPLLNAFDMAFAADAYWMPKVPLIDHNPFALIYFMLFTGPSFSTHPSISAVAKVVTGVPPDLTVGSPASLNGAPGPYGSALLAFINMLLCASRTLGWPDEDGVLAILGLTRESRFR